MAMEANIMLRKCNKQLLTQKEWKWETALIGEEFDENSEFISTWILHENSRIPDRIWGGGVSLERPHNNSPKGSDHSPSCPEPYFIQQPSRCFEACKRAMNEEALHNCSLLAAGIQRQIATKHGGSIYVSWQRTVKKIIILFTMSVPCEVI